MTELVKNRDAAVLLVPYLVHSRGQICRYHQDLTRTYCSDYDLDHTKTFRR